MQTELVLREQTHPRLSWPLAADEAPAEKSRAKRTPNEKRLRRISKRQSNPTWNKDCEFRPKLDTDSRASWTVIPTVAGHRFQGRLDSPKS